MGFFDGGFSMHFDISIPMVATVIVQSDVFIFW